MSFKARCAALSNTRKIQKHANIEELLVVLYCPTSPITCIIPLAVFWASAFSLRVICRNQKTTWLIWITSYHERTPFFFQSIRRQSTRRQHTEKMTVFAKNLTPSQQKWGHIFLLTIEPWGKLDYLFQCLKYFPYEKQHNKLQWILLKKSFC